MVIFVKPVKHSLNIWNGRREDQWEVRSKGGGGGGVGGGDGACICAKTWGRACVCVCWFGASSDETHSAVWYFQHWRILHSSATHGSNLNSKPRQSASVYICVCVWVCVGVCVHVWIALQPRAAILHISVTHFSSSSSVLPKQHTHKTIVFVFISPSIFCASPCVRSPSFNISCCWEHIYSELSLSFFLSPLFILTLFLFRKKRKPFYPSLLLSSFSFCTFINLPPLSISHCTPNVLCPHRSFSPSPPLTISSILSIPSSLQPLLNKFAWLFRSIGSFYPQLPVTPSLPDPTPSFSLLDSSATKNTEKALFSLFLHFSQFCIPSFPHAHPTSSSTVLVSPLPLVLPRSSPSPPTPFPRFAPASSLLLVCISVVLGTAVKGKQRNWKFVSVTRVKEGQGGRESRGGSRQRRGEECQYNLLTQQWTVKQAKEECEH